MLKRILFALIAVGCLFVSLDSFAQFYTTGEDPASVKWRIIKGSHYSVIYPQEIDSLAKRYYFLLEKNRRSVLAGLKIDPAPVPVVLHPYSARSNGLVVWTPKRMELYTQPSANNTYSQNWEEQLVLHESRHVGQVEHFTKGVFKPLSLIIGQQSPGIGVALYPSKWFMEGDAVVAETELSQSGRGRSASFLSYYRLSFLSGDYRSWNSWRFGSLKYYTPDHYALGYMLLSTARYKTGNYALAGDILTKIVKWFYIVDNKDYVYKRVVGFMPRKLMVETDSLMTKLWREELIDEKPSDSELKIVSGTATKSRSDYFTRYTSITASALSGRGYPDTLYAVKSSYNKPSVLVRVLYYGDNKSIEETIRPFSSALVGRLQYGNGKLFWCETINDIRWGHRSFNTLFSYDVDSGRIAKLSRNKSYNNPSLSATGDTVVVSEYYIKGGSSVVLLRSSDGAQILSVPAPSDGQAVDCDLSRGILYATVITDAGIGLYSRAIYGGEWSSIIAPQRANIRDLICDNSHGHSPKLYFTADAGGIDNLYCYDIARSGVYKITKHKFGLNMPLAVNGRLFCIEPGINSNNIVTIKKADFCEEDYCNKSVLMANKVVTRPNYPIAESLSEQIKAIGNTDCDSVEMPSSRPYNKLSNLFRIHSWAPVYYNVDKLSQMSYDNFYEVVGIGGTIYSQNTLGTAITMLGYSYREGGSNDKGVHAGHFKFTYSGFYPVIELSADLNNEQRYKTSFKYDSYGKILHQNRNKISSPYLEAELRSYLPLTFDSHGWQRGIIPQISYKLENNLFYSGDKYIQYDQLRFILQGYVMRPVAKAAVYPRYGAGIIARSSLSPSGFNFYSPLASIKAYFYLPGLFSTHGIKVTAEYQRQFTEGRTYYIKNLINMPPGYDNDITADHLSNIGVSYALPLYLNDIDLGFFAYLQRVQLIPFADYGRYKKRRVENSGNITGNLYSFGSDFLVDGHFFRIGAPMSIGFRYARLKYDPLYKNSKNHFALLFNISLTK